MQTLKLRNGLLFFSHPILDWNRVASGNFHNSYDKLGTPLLTASVEFFCKKNAKEEKKLVKCILFDWIDFFYDDKHILNGDSFDFFFSFEQMREFQMVQKKNHTSILDSDFHYSHRLRPRTKMGWNVIAK